MLNGTTVKAIGLVATLAGFGLTLVSNWSGNKQMDEKIAKEVAKAVAKQG